MRMVLGLLILCGLAGCGYWNVKHEPASVERVQAQQLTERLLWEQYRGFAPKEVEVTSTYFRTKWLRKASTVYYDNIGEVKLEKNGDLYRVTIRDKSEHDLYLYYSIYPEKSKQFVDAITSLRLST